MMSVVTGCADRRFNEMKSFNSYEDAIKLTFITLNELALFIPETEKRKAVAAQKAEELSKDRRFEELKELVSKGGAGEQYELANCYFDGQGRCAIFRRRLTCIVWPLAKAMLSPRIN